MKTLTIFQETCLQELEQALARVNRCLEAQHLTGTHETYIHAKVSNSPLEVWIYDDEAMFLGPGIDERFEQPDYTFSKELISAFVRGVLNHLDVAS